MDIRNISTFLDKTPLENGHLEFIYEKGEEQFKAYQTIDNAPDFPLDVNTRSSQVVLKDFIGRVIEELSEGYESLSNIPKLLNGNWNIGMLNKQEYTAICNELQNANEEQADAIGFFITLMLYANILPEDIYDYAKHNFPEEKFDGLGKLMACGYVMLQRELQMEIRLYPEYLGYIIMSKELIDEAGLDYNKIITYTPGFHELNDSILKELQVRQLWLITYNLNMARNILKNRPWKQTPMMTKELDFQEYLVKSFLYYLGYLVSNGFDQNSLTRLFYKKQQLNLWRIKTGY